MEIFRTFRFDAAHRLPCVPAEHKCGVMHGHTFQVTVHITSAVGADTGWIMDFADLTNAVQPLIDKLDHSCLNEIEGLENPTSENLARWLWQRLDPGIPGLSKIVVQESPDSGCIYKGKE